MAIYAQPIIEKDQVRNSPHNSVFLTKAFGLEWCTNKYITLKSLGDSPLTFFLYMDP
jgi:hypothetical protein